MFRKLRRRFGTGEVLLFGIFIAIAAVAVVVLTPPGGSSTTSATLQGWTQTSQGPLSPADRDFLAKVRQAGLWEIPTGQQAQQRAENKLVKEVGMHLMTDHLKLDEEVREIAAKLNVVLPSQPNADQQGWMAQLSRLSGAEYDRTFAQLLRQAHGKVFGVVAGVRAGTRNDLIRSFAQRAVNVVMKHMALLESTGLVDYSILPEPPAPSPPPATAALDTPVRREIS
jgi:predicted outer membrane protein